MRQRRPSKIRGGISSFSCSRSLGSGPLGNGTICGRPTRYLQGSTATRVSSCQDRLFLSTCICSTAIRNIGAHSANPCQSIPTTRTLSSTHWTRILADTLNEAKWYVTSKTWSGGIQRTPARPSCTESAPRDDASMSQAAPTIMQHHQPIEEER